MHSGCTPRHRDGRASHLLHGKCAHPSHLTTTLRAARERDEPWLRRLKGFRANASKQSHEELDESPELDRGDPRELAVQLAAMRDDLDLRVVGGCCGTDVEHIAEIAGQVTSAQSSV